MNRQEWLQLRMKSIGSSDAPNLLGIGYRTAADVYWSKVEPPPEGVIDSDLQRGLDLEPIVARKYTEQTGVELIPAGFVRSAVNPWQSSNPDYKEADTGRYVEIKTCRGFDREQGWGEPYTDQIPEGYTVQVQHQMGVRGDCDHMDLAAFDIYTWSLRVYRINFDREFFDWLTEIERKAWIEIEARRPLGVAWEDQFREQYERRVSRPGTLKLDDKYAELIDQMMEYKAISKESDELAENLKTQIRQVMGIVELATTGPWRIKRTVTSNNQVRYTFTKRERAS